MSNYSAPTRHPVTGAIEMADWLDDHDGKHRYGVRFPSDGKIYGGKECVEVRPREMLEEIERLRAALRTIAGHKILGVVPDDYNERSWTLHNYVEIREIARAALAGEKTNGSN